MIVTKYPWLLLLGCPEAHSHEFAGLLFLCWLVILSPKIDAFIDTLAPDTHTLAWLLNTAADLFMLVHLWPETNMGFGSTTKNDTNNVNKKINKYIHIYIFKNKYTYKNRYMYIP